MRSIKAGLRSYLDGHASTGGRPVKLNTADPGDALPYIVIKREGQNNYETLDADDGSLRDETFRISVYASTDAEADPLSDAMQAHLASFTGAMGSDRVAVGCTIDDVEDDLNAEEFGAEIGRVVDEFMVTIQHKPAT